MLSHLLIRIPLLYPSLYVSGYVRAFEEVLPQSDETTDRYLARLAAKKKSSVDCEEPACGILPSGELKRGTLPVSGPWLVSLDLL